MYGYTTSEGMFSLCIENNNPNSIPVVENCFFEFLPVDETDYSKTKNLDEVEVGQEYKLIITNQSGFYRYDMHDIIKITGKLNGCPLITFVRRENQCINVMGEKLSSDEVNCAISGTFNELSTSIIDYTVTVNTASPIGYDFFVESDSDFDITVAENVLNKYLRKYNEYYITFTDRGVLAKPRIFKLSKNTFIEYKKYKDHAHNNQFKQLHILEDSGSVNFFKSRIN